MDNLRGHRIEPVSSWGELFDFIPKYTSDKKTDITTISNIQMLIFYGCCCYLLHGEYEENTYNDWNRVLWNICENRVDKSNLQPTITEIDILSPHSHSIIEYLSQDEEIECKYNKDQLLEEQRKARKLNQYPEIIEAECYSFFKGAIRFLYTGNNGEQDWPMFKQKYKQAKLFFTADGKVNSLYSKDSKLLRLYISFFDETNWNMKYDNNASSWRDRLLKVDLYSQNHSLLLCDDVLVYDYNGFVSLQCDCRLKYAHEHMVRTCMWNSVWSDCQIYKESGYCHNSVVLHPYNAKAKWKYYVLNPRTDLLFSCNDITFQDSNLEKCRSVRLMFGTDINFSYRDYRFQWYAWGEAMVYLMKSEWADYEVRLGQESNNNEKEKYFCVEVDPYNCDHGQFINLLEQIIQEYST